MTKAVDLLVATATWGGIGYLVDRFAHTKPLCMAIGAVIGFLTGIYIQIKRYMDQTAEHDKATIPGVVRSWPKRAAPQTGGVDTGSDDKR